MAVKSNNVAWIAFLIIAIMFANKSSVTTQSSNTTSPNPYIDLVNPGVQFSGQDIFVSGESLSTEYVRAVWYNPQRQDLGFYSLDRSTLDTDPTVKYKFYFFMNDTPSANYYVKIMDYTAPIKDATESMVGEGCQIDKSIVYSALDEYGRTQTATVNAQSLSASEEKDVTVRLKVHSDKCYGMTQASKDNIICFGYIAAAISNIRATGTSASAPISIAGSSYMAGKATSCFNFKKMQDAESIDINVHLTAGTTEPTSAHNITVMSDDIAFDLNKITLDEIYGYVDEDGNQLAADAQYLGKIYIT